MIYTFNYLFRGDIKPIINPTPTPPEPTPPVENSIEIKYKFADMVYALQNNRGYLYYPDQYWDDKQDQIEIQNPNVRTYTNIIAGFDTFVIPENMGRLKINQEVLDMANSHVFQGHVILPSNQFNDISEWNNNGLEYITSLDIDVSNLNPDQTLVANNATCSLTGGVVEIAKAHGGVINLPQRQGDPEYDALTLFERNNKNYETSISINVNDLNFAPDLTARGVIVLSDEMIRKAKASDTPEYINIPSAVYENQDSSIDAFTVNTSMPPKTPGRLNYYNYATNYQLNIRNIHTIGDARLDPATTTVTQNGTISLINADDDPEIEVVEPTTLKLIKTNELENYKEKLKLKRQLKKLEGKDVIMKDVNDTNDDEEGEEEGEDGPIEDNNPVIDLGNISINVPNQYLNQFNCVGVAGTGVIGNTPEDGDIRTVNFSEFSTGTSYSEMNVDEIMISIIDYPANPDNFYYIIIACPSQALQQAFVSKLLPMKNNLEEGHKTVWWKNFKIYDEVPSDWGNLGLQLGIRDSNNDYKTIQCTKNDYINTDSERTAGFYVAGHLLHNDNADWVKSSNGFILNKTAIIGLPGTDFVDPIPQNFNNQGIINELPVETTLNKNGFYVQNTDDTISNIPVTVGYTDYDGNQRLQTVNTIKPFKILNEYTVPTDFITNGEHTLVFDNGNYPTEKDLVGAPVNKVRFNINIPSSEDIQTDKTETILTNGEHEITPDTPYTALSKVNLNVQVPNTEIISNIPVPVFITKEKFYVTLSDDPLPESFPVPIMFKDENDHTEERNVATIIPNFKILNQYNRKDAIKKNGTYLISFDNPPEDHTDQYATDYIDTELGLPINRLRLRISIPPTIVYKIKVIDKYDANVNSGLLDLSSKVQLSSSSVDIPGDGGSIVFHNYNANNYYVYLFAPKTNDETSQYYQGNDISGGDYVIQYHSPSGSQLPSSDEPLLSFCNSENTEVMKLISGIATTDYTTTIRKFHVGIFKKSLFDFSST